MLPPRSMLTIKNPGGKSRWILPLFLGLFLAGCVPPGPRALLNGKKLLEAGKPAEAVEQLKTATSLMPTNALAYNYLGLACHAAGMPLEAEKAYGKALALNHDLAEVHYNLGCLWLSQDKLQQARSELTIYTLRRGGSPEGWLKLGAVQLRAREPGAAEKSFYEALRLSTNNPEGLTGLGLARLQRSKPTEAAQFFAKALKEQSDYRPALLNLAIVEHEYLKDRPQALTYYRQLLALKPPPENAGAIERVARSLEQEINSLQAPPVPVPTNPPAPNLAASAQQKSTQPQTSATIAALGASKPTVTNLVQAPTAPRPAAAATPPKPEPAVAKSNLATNPAKAATSPTAAAQPSTVGDSSKTSSVPVPAPTRPVETVTVPSEPVIQPAQDPQPARISKPVEVSSAATSPLATNTTGSTSAPKRGLLQKINPARLFDGNEQASAPSTSNSVSATAGSQKAATTRPAPVTSAKTFPRYPYRSPTKPSPGNRAEAERSFAQGVQAHKAERLAEAVQAYRRATQLDPAYFDAHYNLGLAATAMGNTQTALSAYETALAVCPESLDGRYNFALLLKQANYPLDAANELEKILAGYPNESRAHLALGNLYAQQLGNPVQARQHYVKVLETDPRNPQAPVIRYWLTDNPKK